MSVAASRPGGLTLDSRAGGGAFDELRGEWVDLEGRAAEKNMFLTWTWHHAWWKELGGNRPLAILAFRDAGRLVGICPTYEEPEPNGDSGAARTMVRFGGGLEVTDYLGFLVESGSEAEVGRAFLAHYTSRDDVVLDFHYLRADGLTLRALRAAAAGLGWAVEEALEEVSPRIPLAGDWDTYLAALDKKDRHELRRKRRRLEEAGGWTVDESTPATLAADMERFFDLHQRSTRAKSDFMTDEIRAFFMHISAEIQAAGWLCLRTLVHEGQAVAAVLGFRYDGRLLLYNSGYDPEYNRLSCGFVLMTEEIRLAIEEGMSEVDFLRGNERYKYELGARDLDLLHLRVTPA